MLAHRCRPALEVSLSVLKSVCRSLYPSVCLSVFLPVSIFTSYLPPSLFPGCLLHVSSIPLSSLLPPSLAGLCPELQSLFAMTMTSSDRLPFPRRLGLAAGDRLGGQSVDRRDRGDRESLSVENVRDGSAPGVGLALLNTLNCCYSATLFR